MFKSAADLDNWVFVTGVPRSGTTFVGMNLSIPKEVDYIHEPFNPMCGIPEFRKGTQNWYRYLSGSANSEEKLYQQGIQSVFDYSINLKKLVSQKDTLSRKIIKQIVGSRGTYYLRLAKLNPWREAAIIKDPVGILLTEYLYLKFQVKPVIVVKHPASFIASLKRVGFNPSPVKLQDQQHLKQDYFAEEAQFFDKQWSDPLLAAAAFWRIVYKVILTQAKKYPGWIVLTHEELSQQPVETFHHLYEQLDLPWSTRVEHKIRVQTEGNKSADAKQGVVQDFKRNSADIFQQRINSLSQQERQDIFEITGDVALQLYSKDSFAVS